MTLPTYSGIRFPSRAEAIDDYEAYRIFLKPWEPIASKFQNFWEPLANNRNSGILAIYGKQGAGKTLFTKKIVADYTDTENSKANFRFDDENIWHRVTGGRDQSVRDQNVLDSTANSILIPVQNTDSWVEDAKKAFANQGDRRMILVADNAERPYFRRGLVAMSELEFIQTSHNPQLNKLAATQLVDLLRTELRGTLLIALSNDRSFLESFLDGVESQHSGMMELTDLSMPDSLTTETVIRVNTNRLNKTSYWSAIDQSTPGDREALRRALNNGSSFPDSFQAVDTASRNRTGRPAKKNLITLVCLSNTDDASTVDLGLFGEVKTEEVNKSWMRLAVFDEGWASSSLGDREASLLESEWSLRICILGNPFVAHLLDTNDGSIAPALQKSFLQVFFKNLKTYQGPGTSTKTRTKYSRTLEGIVDSWPSSDRDLSTFWNGGQTRSTIYEPALKNVLPKYNIGGSGFLNYRPDFIVKNFQPCSIARARGDSNKEIRAAIKREAHVWEFTALGKPDGVSIQSYLEGKLPNYVTLTQEQ